MCTGGQACNPDTGACEANACDDTNCPNGCCTANGQCVTYGEQSTSACGEAGAACAVCPGGTLACTEGSCIMDQPCFEFCDNGCCTPTGQCIPFANQANNMCGGDGAGSELCAACTGDLSCVAGACVADPVYRVVIVSAVISQNKSGTAWDSVVFTNPLPDPYVGFALATDTFLDGFTPTIDNTITPNWNHAIGNYLGSELVSEGLGFNVRDSDGLGVFETIGACSHTVTANELASGTKTFASCGQYVMNLRVNFVLQ